VPELRHPRRRPDAARGQPGRRERPRPPEEGPLIRKSSKRPAALVLGIGNPGRRDDGLGAALVERLAKRRLKGVVCDADYQLNVEDALACAAHDLVVFVDAARGLRRPFAFTRVRPAAGLPALSHALSPGAVLGIAAGLYGKTPDARLLAVRGHSFAVGEGLTARAEENLGLALAFLLDFLKGGRS
jgi:hydrogenase maturation protease